MAALDRISNFVLFAHKILTMFESQKTKSKNMSLMLNSKMLKTKLNLMDRIIRYIQ